MLSMLSMAGLGVAGNLGNGDIGRLIDRTVTGTTYYITNATIYYDSSGHPVVYADLDPIGENGKIIGVENANVAAWDNSTGLIHTSIWDLYYDTGGQDAILYKDAIAQTWTGDEPAYTRAELGVNVSTSYGLIAVVLALMALALLVGIKVAASGESEVTIGMVIKCTGYISVWAIFSVLSIALLSSVTILTMFYLLLTVMYTLGMINSIGSPSNE